MAEQQEQTAGARLASASPRRRQLLELIGVPHVVTPADIDETPRARRAARRLRAAAGARKGRGRLGTAPRSAGARGGHHGGGRRRDPRQARIGSRSALPCSASSRAASTWCTPASRCGRGEHQLHVGMSSTQVCVRAADARGDPRLLGRAANRRARPARMPSRDSARCS